MKEPSNATAQAWGLTRSQPPAGAAILRYAANRAVNESHGEVLDWQSCPTHYRTNLSVISATIMAINSTGASESNSTHWLSFTRAFVHGRSPNFAAHSCAPLSDPDGIHPGQSRLLQVFLHDPSDVFVRLDQPLLHQDFAFSGQGYHSNAPAIAEPFSERQEVVVLAVLRPPNGKGDPIQNT